MSTQLTEHDHQPEQEPPHSENHLKQAEPNSFQFAEKETGYAGLQNFTGPKVDVGQTSGEQQHVKQMVGQQAPPGAQDARKRGYQPSIPFNMLIPILQAHLDRDKDMQLQTVWAKLRVRFCLTPLLLAAVFHQFDWLGKLHSLVEAKWGAKLTCFAHLLICSKLYILYVVNIIVRLLKFVAKIRT